MRWAIFSAAIIGSRFFEVVESVNSGRYANILKDFFPPRLEELNVGDIRFQQDSATRQSMAVLREHFAEGLISIKGDLKCPD